MNRELRIGKLPQAKSRACIRNFAHGGFSCCIVFGSLNYLKNYYKVSQHPMDMDESGHVK